MGKTHLGRYRRTPCRTNDPLDNIPVPELVVGTVRKHQTDALTHFLVFASLNMLAMVIFGDEDTHTFGPVIELLIFRVGKY